MKKVDRSYLMKERHRIARESRDIYRQITKKDRPYREFFSNKNPIKGLIKKFEVTYYLDFYNKEKNYSFHIDQNTFDVYVVDYGDTQQHLRDTVARQIVNVFQGDKRKNWVAERLNVDVKSLGQLRGIEEKDEGISYYELDSILRGFKVSKGDLNIVVRKNSKKWEYKLNLWL